MINHPTRPSPTTAVEPDLAPEIIDRYKDLVPSGRRGRAQMLILARDHVGALIADGQKRRARAEELEALARAERDELADVATRLRSLRLPHKLVAALLGYASDNSIRQKTRPTHDSRRPQAEGTLR